MSTVTDDRRRPQFDLRHRLILSREVAGVEQAQVAEILGVSRTTISNYERGYTSPRRATLLAWAMATGVDADWLMTGAESPAPSGPGGGAEWAPRGSNPRPAD